jgi:WD40 repeat protein
LKILRRVHLAGVRDGNTLRLYVDGKLQDTTATLMGFKASPYPLSIGADPKGLFKMEHFFHGLIDEVRISRCVRYTEDFTPAKRLGPDADTLALYHCDEGSGNRLNDSSGNGYHGTIQNAKWVRADVVPVAQKPKQFADAKNPLPRLAALPAHVASIAAVVVAWDEGLVITGGVDAAVYLWDLNQRKQLLKLTQASASIGCLGISPDNRWLAIGTTKGEVELWNLPERLLHRRWKNAGGFVRSLVFIPDSKQLYIAGKQIFLWPMDEETTAIRTVVDQGVFDLAITKDGQALITGAPDGKVTVYTIAGELKLEREFSTGGILHGLALSPDGRQLLTVGGVGWKDQLPGQVQIWDWSSGTRLKNFVGHRGFASDGEFMPDGRHVVTGGRNDRTLRVWNVETEQAVSCVASDSHCFAFLTVAPDGQQIFSGGGSHYEFGKYEDDGDNRLFFWSLEDIRARKALP